MSIFTIGVEFFHFLSAIYLLFYLPGRIVISFSSVKLSALSTVFLSFMMGSVLFTLLMYILSWLGFQMLIYPLIATSAFIAFKKQLVKFPSLPRTLQKPVIITSFVSLFFSLPMFLNGNFANSIYYFGDDIAHLAYINELRFTFPPEHPGFAGVPLQGYHFFYDFLVSQISNVSFLSHISLYFHFMPLFVAFGWGFGTLTLLFSWTKNTATALVGVFLVLFGSSFGYLVSLYSENFKFSENFGIDQPYTALWNAPYSFSVVLVLTGLILTKIYLKSRSLTYLYLLAIIVGVTPIFKVYAGILLIAGFGILCLYELCNKRFHVITAGTVALLVFLGTFGVFSGEKVGIFFYPLWPIERVFENMFPEYGYKEKIETYSTLGVIRGLLETHLYTFSVFIFGNLGSRIVGLLFLGVMALHTKKAPTFFSLIVLSMFSMSILFPLLFAQTIKPFDMIQMTWYFPLFASLISAIGISYVLSARLSKHLKWAFLIVLFLLTIPLTVYNFLNETIPLMTVKRISYSSERFQSMNFLRGQGTYHDTVLTLPLSEAHVHYENLKSWYNASSADLAAFGNKRMYVGNQYITFPNMPLDERLSLLEQINRLEYTDQLNTPTVPYIIQKLKEEKISYIYTEKPLLRLNASEDITLLFQNSYASIYEVR